MNALLLLGDEAIAQGAIDGGLSGVYAYPGTPSTEITEYIQESEQARERNIHREWSANEKTAMEAALGMSYSGKRTMVCMKHVGLNVAADAFVNAAITGINGGLVVVVADDPSMHSSQNEQDSRFYGQFAMIPILEPNDQQEAYEMAYMGFELSEKYNVPVMLRITTRLAHSRSGIIRKDIKKENDLKLPGDAKQFVLLPAIARKRYKSLLDNQPNLEKSALESMYNKITGGSDSSLAIIACGIAYNYLQECFEDGNIPYPTLKLSQYPIPGDLIHQLAKKSKTILVLEDGYPLVEEKLKGFFPTETQIQGKLSGHLPRYGELNPDIVARSLGVDVPAGAEIPEVVQSRPPALCKGCGHADLYHALNEALDPHGKGHVFSDIGCYTLGALPPFDTINSCVDMGASVTMAKGAADAGLHPAVAVIGDSTFTHSGMTGLLDAINENSPITLIISDNSTTGMTGGQTSAATGKLENICLGLGVDPGHLKTMVPLRKNHDEMVATITGEFNYKGVSVIIAQRECIQTAARRKKLAKKLEENKS